MRTWLVSAVGALCLWMVSPAAAQSLSVRHSAETKLAPGDVIVVTAVGAPRMTARFSLGELVRDLPMAEPAPGNYRGEYTVKRGEELNGQWVRVELTSAQYAPQRAQAPWPLGTPAPKADPVITTLAVNPYRWIGVGGMLNIEVTGTPGCVASLSIAGAIRDVRLLEQQPGRYTGQLTLPAGELVAPAAIVVAKLVQGDRGVLHTGAQPVAIDLARPLVVDSLPVLDALLSLPPKVLIAVLDDGVGSGIDPGSLRLVVDGFDQTDDLTLADGLLTYRPDTPFGPGAHEAKLTFKDRAGNAALPFSWRFTLPASVPASLTLFHSAIRAVPAPGEVLSVWLTAPAGGRAVCALGEGVTGLVMAEHQPGHYRVDYTVRGADRLTGAKVSVVFTGTDRRQTTVVATKLIGGNAATVRTPTPVTPGPAAVAPVFTAPADNAEVGDTIVCRGRARPLAKVRLTIEARSQVAGLLELNRTLPEQTVEVKADGTWASAPIALTKPSDLFKATFTITATTIDGPRTYGPTVVKVVRP